MKPTSDTWVGNKLIENCHIRFGAGVLCLVYLVPGLVLMIGTMMDPDNQDETCISLFLKGLKLFIFFVPASVIALFVNLIKLNDDWSRMAKG